MPGAKDFLTLAFIQELTIKYNQGENVGLVAEDGERVTIVEFESEEGMRAWATHPEHADAKKKGRSVFFTEYRVQVCNVVRDTADHWSRTVGARTIL